MTGNTEAGTGRPDLAVDRPSETAAGQQYSGQQGSISYDHEYKGIAPMDRFAVSVGDSGQGRYVVTVRGELDLATSDRLWIELEPLLAPQTVVVLDGTEISFLDSSGLRVLLQANNRATTGGAEFRLVAPQQAVQRVLDLAGTGDHLQTRDTVDEALAG